MTNAFNDSLETDRRLFRAEIRAAAAHADALFRAGILTRPEAERIKNGLWTILKRAEIDRHYFDSLSSPDVFAFVEARLFQLINVAAEKLKIGRNREYQAAVALRLWLREEMRLVGESLEHLQDALHDVENLSTDFLEPFRRDSEKIPEISRRVNRMPVAALNLAEDEHLAELDFEAIGRELEFDSVLSNSAESDDRDFCLEFTNAAAFIMLHLSRLANEILLLFPALSEETKQTLKLVRGKSGKIFGYQTALTAVLSDISFSGNSQVVNEIVFDAAETVKTSLDATTIVLQRL